LSTRFAWRSIPVSVRTCPVWLIQVHSPVILLSLAAPFAIRTFCDDGNSAQSRRMAGALLVYCAVVFACYIAYVPMDGPPFVRFLLPAIPVLFILTAIVLSRAIAWLPARVRASAAVLVFGVITAASADRAY